MAIFVRPIAALVIVVVMASAQVRVRGYVRHNVTHAQPHYRSNPDGSFYNNWSTRGTVNPYTGEAGTRVTPPAGSPGGSGYEALFDYYRNSKPIPEPRRQILPPPDFS